MCREKKLYYAQGGRAAAPQLYVESHATCVVSWKFSNYNLSLLFVNLKSMCVFIRILKISIIKRQDLFIKL